MTIITNHEVQEVKTASEGKKLLVAVNMETKRRWK
jgi:hypothetical protein